MKLNCSGIILAGGLNSRFFGKNKAFLKIGDKKLIDHIYDIFRQIFKEVIIVTNSPEAYEYIDAFIVTDIIAKRSSLAGIHTGLFYSGFKHSFFSACDMPFLKKELAEAIASEISNNIDVIVPQTSFGFEPLCAVYSKKCIPVIDNMLKKDSFDIRAIFNKVKTKKLSEKYIKKFDSEMISFFNINSEKDFNSIKR